MHMSVPPFFLQPSTAATSHCPILPVCWPPTSHLALESSHTLSHAPPQLPAVSPWQRPGVRWTRGGEEVAHPELPVRAHPASSSDRGKQMPPQPTIKAAMNAGLSQAALAGCRPLRACRCPSPPSPAYVPGWRCPYGRPRPGPLEALGTATQGLWNLPGVAESRC